MKTLSNAELQDAIIKAHWLARNSTGPMSNKAHAHYDMLLDEQMKRATERTELTPDPMTTTLERAEFDARVAAQDGPEWVEWGGGECPVPLDHTVEVELWDGFVYGRMIAGNLHWVSTNNPYAIARYKDWTAWEQSK